MSAASIARRLLLPLVPLYRLGLSLGARRAQSPRHLRWPVISIGNLSTGGTGKTPTTIALAKNLKQSGLHVDVLSRGYGRTSTGVLRVDPEGTPEQFGDEPMLIAREAEVPVYVGAERYEAGLLAEREFAGATGVHLLDDGFQHRQLARNVDVLLVNRDDLRDRLLPAGNLREPLNAMLRANILAIPADDPELENELKTRGFAGTFWRLHRVMEVPPLAGPVVAFCGIARPEQFFNGLTTAGVHVASRIAFRDHHRYVQHDVDCLLDAGRGVGATAFVTTEKDRVRLGQLSANFDSPRTLHVARLRVKIENCVMLLTGLKRGGGSPAEDLR